MPYRRNSRKKPAYRSKRRPFKRGTKFRKHQKGSNRVRSAFIAPQMYTKLKYMERVVLSSTVGAPTGRLYRGNSPYDPDFAVGGIAALGFNQYANLYEKYRCYGSKVTVRTVLDQSSANDSYELGLIPISNGFTSNPAPEIIKMNPRGKFTLTSGSGGATKGYLKHYSNISSVLGKTKSSIRDDDQASSAINTNPEMLFYWQVGMQPADHTSTMTVIAYVEIVYYVKFEYRRVLN